MSIAQDAADEWHIKEALSGLETELESMDDSMEALKDDTIGKISELKAEYEEVAILRRRKTDFLAANSPAYDYHQRCRLKHRATSFVLATEVFLADPAPDTYDIMKQSEDLFWKTVKRFMGVDDIPNCGRCLSDELNRELHH